MRLIDAEASRNDIKPYIKRWNEDISAKIEEYLMRAYDTGYHDGQRDIEKKAYAIMETLKEQS